MREVRREMGRSEQGTKKLVEVAVVWNYLHIFSIDVNAHTSFSASFSTSLSHFSHMCHTHSLICIRHGQ